MTELTSRPDDELADDEIVSAVLDGEGTPDEVARVLTEPRLAARLEVMRSVAEATGAAVPAPPHHVVHNTIARILTPSTPSAPTPSAPTTRAPAKHNAVAPVTLVAPRRARRSRSLRTLSIAAAVLAAVLAPLVLSRTGGGGPEDQAASSESAAELRARGQEQTSDAAGTDEAEDNDDDGSTAAGDAPSELAVPDPGAPDPGAPDPGAPDPGTVEVIDLGPLPDVDALRQAVLDLVTTEAAGLPPPTTVVAADLFDARDPARCLAQGAPRGTADGSLDVVRAWARFQGEWVTVYVTTLQDGSREVVAVASESCAERARLLVSG